MKTKRFLSFLAMTMVMVPLFAKGRMSEEELRSTAEKMENDWSFASPMVRWMEDDSAFDYYWETIPDRCADDLEEVLEMAEPCYQESQQVLQLAKQIYRRPGARKWEARLAQYFEDTDRAKEKIASARRNVAMYKKMAKKFPSIIDGKRKRTYPVPQGDLVRFEYRSGGGMLIAPPIHRELKRQDDGSYIAVLETDSFNKFDTLSVTKAQVSEIRKMLIDGNISKMPRYNDSPLLILDAPSTSVSVEFTDRDFSCNSVPSEEWGGKGVMAVYFYLENLRPKE